MSSLARSIIAACTLASAFSLVALPLLFPAAGMDVVRLWLVSAFCLLVARACFPGPGRGLALRVIGAAIFGLTLFGLIDRAHSSPGHGCAAQSGHFGILDAFPALCIYGLPGLWVALTGRLSL